MKKGVIVSVVIVIVGVAAFGFINLSDLKSASKEAAIVDAKLDDVKAPEKANDKIFTDFIYDVGPRFEAITKSELDKVTTFTDFIGEEHAQRIVSFKSMSVILFEGEKRSEVKESILNTNVFTTAQKEKMQSLPYSTNFMVWADYTEKNEETGELEDNHWTPHLTIVPETQAEYESGREGLKSYLIANTREMIANVNPEKLKPAKLYFRVTREGTLKDIRLDRSSGYPEVDNGMIELVSKLPGIWRPAENSEGEKVDQELVVSFGLMGC